MTSKNPRNVVRPSFWEGLLQFPLELLMLLGVKENITLYALGALTMAILLSLIVAILGLIAYGFIEPSAEIILFDRSIRVGNYLDGMYPNIIFLLITIILGSGWWQVYQYKRKALRCINILLNKDSSTEDQRTALDDLASMEQLARGVLRDSSYTLGVSEYPWDNVDLRGTTFKGGSLQKCTFKKTELQGANFIAVDLTGAVFEDTIFVDEGGDSCRFIDCILQDVSFKGSIALGNALKGIDLTNTKFSNAILLSPSSLESANLQNVDFKGSDLTYLIMKSALNSKSIIFDDTTKLPRPINFNEDIPKNDDVVQRIKTEALTELQQNASHWKCRERLWYRFTRETTPIPVPAQNNTQDDKILSALETKYGFLIEEFGDSSKNTHIYATAFIEASIFFEQPDTHQRIRGLYLDAHKSAINNNIIITRIFVIDEVADLDRRFEVDGNNQTVKEFIMRHNSEYNIAVAVCLTEWLNNDTVVAMHNGNEDVVIFEDKNDMRCYILSNIRAPSAGALLRAEDEINRKLKAFKSLIDRSRDENILFLP